MADVESRVQQRYTQGDMLARVNVWLKTNGKDLGPLKPEDLHAFDQLHGRGIAATREHAERAGIRADMHVLDLGCGVGGSSRYLTSALGCRVSGIDLTQEFIDVARELTRRCGIEVVEFRQANALKLPFADATFDHVWCHNVTMNIPDKAGLAREAGRVLKPGGRFSLVEVAQGPAGAPTFPVPWASTPDESFLATPDEMRRTLEGAGFRIVQQNDDTAASLSFSREMQERAARGETPPQVNQVVAGDDFQLRVRNSGAGLRDGKLRDQFILAEKL